MYRGTWTQVLPQAAIDSPARLTHYVILSQSMTEGKPLSFCTQSYCTQTSLGSLR